MILLITHSADFYTIDIVQQYLEKAGVQTMRLNTDEFALNYRLEYSLRDGKEHVVLLGEQPIDASKISAVWYRKSWKLKLPPDLDPAYHEIFTKEYNTYRQIFFNQLQHLPWINKMQADHAAGNDKLRQLTEARNAGLQIPQTAFTNDPATIQDFYTHCNGNLVVKLHGALSKSMDGSTPFFPTVRLKKQDLQRLDELAYCPMIFQEYIPKSYELRIIYIDGVFYTGKIAHTEETTDWRTSTVASLPWEQYSLPLPVQKKIITLMHSLDLTFGAIDMIRRTNGDYVFLEVNPQGEWGMLQRDLQYPIGETIGAKLLTRTKHVKTKNTDHYAYKG